MKKITLLIALIAICFTQLSVAQVYFMATSDNLWSNPANWDTGVLPVAGDDVVIEGMEEVQLDVNTPVLGDVTINAGGIFNFVAPVTLSCIDLNINGDLNMFESAKIVCTNIVNGNIFNCDNKISITANSLENKGSLKLDCSDQKLAINSFTGIPPVVKETEPAKVPLSPVGIVGVCSMIVLVAFYKKRNF